MQNSKQSSTDIPVCSITQQPSSSFTQNLGNPPPYFPNQNEPTAFATMVQQQQPGLNLEVLRGIESFYIKKTGRATRVAATQSGSHLFSYSESVLVNNGYACLANQIYTDNNGIQFLRAEIDMSGTKIYHDTSLMGVMDPFNAGQTWCGLLTLNVNSTVGLGFVTFKPDDENCCCSSWCYFGSTEGKYNILYNGQSIGQLRTNKSEGTVLSFPQDLDPRLKAIIVVPSFMLFNAYEWN